MSTIPLKSITKQEVNFLTCLLAVPDREIHRKCVDRARVLEFCIYPDIWHISVTGLYARLSNSGWEYLPSFLAFLLNSAHFFLKNTRNQNHILKFWDFYLHATVNLQIFVFYFSIFSKDVYHKFKVLQKTKLPCWIHIYTWHEFNLIHVCTHEWIKTWNPKTKTSCVIPD